MRDLSILIPARNEEWLKNTVEDILKNIEADTEILVGLDGYWPDPGLEDHPRVKIYHVSESIGQRAMQNKLAKMSKAKYVMKCDAHLAFDKGFDRKMIDAMEDDVTMVPVMRNLHVFSWKCSDCGDEQYQGPTPEGCANDKCPVDKYNFEKVLKWIAKPNPQSSAYRFNTNLQFKYFPELRAVQPRTGVQETMSLQGSCFMATREKYWDIELCDESWGSWGQQGTEVALKTWLSGGRVLVNMDTWYAHLFRTQHGFSFPYPMSGRSQEKARRISQDIFKNNAWHKQIRPLSWVLEKFWDTLQQVRDPDSWTDKDLAELKKNDLKVGSNKGIIFYTDNQLNLRLAKKVQENLKHMDLPITSSSLKRMDNMGNNVRLRLKRGTMAYLKQIVAALENSTSKYVFFTEHDVLYHKSHFEFTPPTDDKFYYNINVWRVRPDGKAVTWEANQVAELAGNREYILDWYRKKLEESEKKGFNRRYEPGGRDTTQYEQWKSEYPNIDIRHGANLTKSKWSIKDFRDKTTCINWKETTFDQIPGWQPEQFKDIVDSDILG